MGALLGVWLVEGFTSRSRRRVPPALWRPPGPLPLGRDMAAMGAHMGPSRLSLERHSFFQLHSLTGLYVHANIHERTLTRTFNHEIACCLFFYSLALFFISQYFVRANSYFSSPVASCHSEWNQFKRFNERSLWSLRVKAKCVWQKQSIQVCILPRSWTGQVEKKNKFNVLRQKRTFSSVGGSFFSIREQLACLPTYLIWLLELQKEKKNIEKWLECERKCWFMAARGSYVYTDVP